MKDNVLILLVDDLEKNLVAMEALLRGPGLRVLTARSGDEALEILLANEVALALVDVQMPGMDGFELAELMRGSGRTKHVPIVFVTAGAHDRERLFQGYDAGAVDFLYKPIEPHILTNKVAVFVELFRQKQALARMSVLQSAIFNSANFSSIATDAEGVIQIFNVGAERMLGYSAAEVMNQITPADISDPQEVIARAQALSVELGTPIAPGFEALVFKASRGIEDIYELTYIRKDGSRFPAVVSVTALRDAQEAIIGYLLIGTDNTARKQASHYVRSLLEASLDPLVTISAEGKITDVNEGLIKATGVERQKLIGTDFSDYFTEPEKAREGYRQVFARGFVTDYPLTIRHEHGRLTDVLYNASVYKDAGGQVLGVFAAARDITARKQAEAALLKAGALQRAIFNSANFSSIATDAKGVIQIFNVGAERMLGYSAAEVMNQITPADISDPQEVIARAQALSVELGTPITPGFEALVFKASRGIEDIYELTYIRKDKSRFPAVVSVTALRDAQEAIIGYLLIGTDNTARKQVEEERKKLDQRLRDQQFYTRSLIESNIDALMTTDPQGFITDVNQQMEALTGCTRDELLGAPFKNYFTDPDRAEAAIRQVLDEKKVANYELTARARDGKETVVSYNAATFYDRDRSLQGVFAAARDITERRAAEQRTEIQHAVTRMLAEGTQLPQTARNFLEIICRALGWNIGGLWAVDRSAKVLRCVELWHAPSADFRPFAAASRAKTFVVGAGLPGRIWATAQPVWIPEVAQDATFCRQVPAAQLALRGAMGFPIKLRGEVLGVVDFFSTASHEPSAEVMALFAALGAQLGQFIERQQLAEQFRQAQKMEAIGTLAGGIAHDFNNVLAAIVGYVRLAKEETTGNATLTEYLDDIGSGADRAVDLVQQILAFSRKNELERKPTRLHGVLKEALKLLRATIPATIEFDLSLSADVSPVLVDATQIHQIMMNLGTNAAYAMQARPGRLTIKLENVEIDTAVVAANSRLRLGAYVLLSVSDTGCGMNEATLSRIFEPFFTTKAQGEGTGLGLAVVHGIMRSHEGAVTVASHPGEGTMFHLYFPALAEAAPAIVAETAEAPRGNGERILYLDDEAPLVKIGKRLLEQLGYVVEVHTNSLEALDALRARPGAYDLVITDQMMPRLTGTGLAEQARAIRPELPFILNTGYDATLTVERARAVGIREIIMKPLSVVALGTVVARVLAETKPR